MMKIFFHAILFCLLIQSVFAINWPMFSPPDKAFLLIHRFIDTTNCPRGEGKLVADININIAQHLCKTFCPENWAWTANGNETCHNLDDMTFQRYEINYTKDSDGTIRYSSVIALYGRSKVTKPIFKISFLTPNEHWYCYEANQDSHAIACANDI